ncbi:MAG TPA: hypothetical protein VIC27_01975, partial [Ktedonobacterales bacterium]
PSGYLMVEGVAQSVNALLDTLDGWDVGEAAQRISSQSPQPTQAEPQRPNTPAKPAKRRAFHWLIAPPPPNPGSQSLRHER